MRKINTKYGATDDLKGKIINGVCDNTPSMLAFLHQL